MAFVLGEFFATLKIQLNFILFVELSLISVITIIFNNRRVFKFLGIVCIFIILGFVKMHNMNNALILNDFILSAQDVSIEGKVSKLYTKNSLLYCEIKEAYITAHNNNNCKYYKVILIIEESKSISLKIGNTVKVQGEYKAFYKARNPGNYDEEKYYHSLGVACKFNVKSITIINKSYSVLAESMNQLKIIIKESIDLLCNKKEAAIFSALLLGEKNFLDDTTKDLYRNNGIAHILAISGLHISIIGLGVYNLLRRKLLFLSSSIITIIIMFCFGVMTGNAVSIIRALIMFLFKLLADVLGRTYDMTIAMSFAGFLLLFSNPYYLFNTGFILSFLAIIAIAIIAPVSEKFLAIKNNLNKVLHISIVITILTAPVIINMYYSIPVYSVFINMIVIPLLSIVIISGLVAAVVGIFTLQIGYFIIGIGCYILRVYELLCIILMKLPFSMLVIGELSSFKIYLYYILLVLFTVIMGHINKLGLDNLFWKVRYFKRFFCLIISISFLFILLINPQNNLEITIIDVGQGESILIQTPNDKTFMIDGGSVDISNVARYRMIPTIKSKGISCIDYLFITHMDSDHISGIIEILSNYDEYSLKIKNIILPYHFVINEEYKEIIDMVKACNINIQSISTGVEFNDELVRIKCIHPSNNYNANDINRYSLVLSLTYKNFSILFTGDIDKEVEKSIINNVQLMDYDILKVAHHGSNSSSSQEFLNVIKPEYAIISCGINNQYGHPGLSTIETIKKINAKYYITNEAGAIQITSDGSLYQISTFIKNNEEFNKD